MDFDAIANTLRTAPKEKESGSLLVRMTRSETESGSESGQLDSSKQHNSQQRIGCHQPARQSCDSDCEE
jgi:hypothetical protein